MDPVTLFIPGPLPGLNEIINAKGNTRGKWNAYSKMKKHWGGLIALLARAKGIETIPEGSRFYYRCVEPNRSRDPSNIIAGAVKLIEDGLQEAGILENDGWKHVAGISVGWSVAARIGVHVTITQLERHCTDK